MPRPIETPPGSANLPFESIESYRLLRLIGEGGMGSVFEAIHLDLGQHVALKIIRQDRRSRHEVERFRREMKAIGALAHPNIVRATDAGEDQGRLFLVMELLDGRTFDEVVKNHGPLQFADACELIRQAALGLVAIAAKGRVHRDIKPKNLMLTRDLHREEPIVKILDLGLALIQEESEANEGSGITAHTILGSLDYLSPEQGRRSHDVDIRSDIYSLGCTFYTLLTGEPPYPSPRYKTVTEKLAAHESKPLPPLPDFVPEELRAMIVKMVAKQPTLRYQTPAELVAALTPLARSHHLHRLVDGGSQTPSGLKSKTGSNRADETPKNEQTPNSALPTVELPNPRKRRYAAGVLLLLCAIATSSVIWAVAPWRQVDDPIKNPDKQELANVPVEVVLKDAFEMIDNDDVNTVVDYTSKEKSVPHDLLARSPVKMLWSAKDSARYNAQKKHARLECLDTGFLFLGKIEEPTFELKVTFFDAGFLNNTAVFLGYRPATPGPNTKTPVFTSISLGLDGGIGVKKTSIGRWAPHIEKRGDAAPILKAMVLHAEEKRDAVTGNQSLALYVKDGVLARVTFNGEVLRSLSRYPTPPAQPLGYFGVCQSHSSCTYVAASLTINPDPNFPKK